MNKRTRTVRRHSPCREPKRRRKSLQHGTVFGAFLYSAARFLTSRGSAHSAVRFSSFAVILRAALTDHLAQLPEPPSSPDKLNGKNRQSGRNDQQCRTRRHHHDYAEQQHAGANNCDDDTSAGGIGEVKRFFYHSPVFLTLGGVSRIVHRQMPVQKFKRPLPGIFSRRSIVISTGRIGERMSNARIHMHLEILAQSLKRISERFD